MHLLRAQCDAILVGIGTVLADDPLLTCRLPGMEARSPVRVVLDRALRIPGTSRLVHSARQTPLWVMTSDLAEAPAATKLGAAGAQVIRVAATANPPGLDLAAVLHALSEKGITRLMVEGGARVASSFVAADLVDEIWLLRGPRRDRRRRHSCAGRIAAVGNHPVAARFKFVLAKRWIRTLLPSTSALECLPELSPTSARSSPDADGAGPVAPPAHRLPLRSNDHRRRRLDRLQRRLPDRGRLRRRRRQNLVRRRCRRRDARHDHGQALGKGTKLNLERALKIGDELGGHIVAGHADGIATIVKRDDLPDMARFELRTTRELARFIATKGSITLDGVSLTVNTVEDVVFSVLIIPHTLGVTTLGGWRAGSEVNIEVDLMARYAARLSEMK